MNGTMRDVSERCHAEQQIQRLAYYDGLTGLPNRQLFGERAGAAPRSASMLRCPPGSSPFLFLAPTLTGCPATALPHVSARQTSRRTLAGLATPPPRFSQPPKPPRFLRCSAHAGPLPRPFIR